MRGVDLKPLPEPYHRLLTANGYSLVNRYTYQIYVHLPKLVQAMKADPRIDLSGSVVTPSAITIRAPHLVGHSDVLSRLVAWSQHNIDVTELLWGDCFAGLDPAQVMRLDAESMTFFLTEMNIFARHVTIREIARAALPDFEQNWGNCDLEAYALVHATGPESVYFISLAYTPTDSQVIPMTLAELPEKLATMHKAWDLPFYPLTDEPIS